MYPCARLLLMFPLYILTSLSVLNCKERRKFFHITVSNVLWHARFLGGILIQQGLLNKWFLLKVSCEQYISNNPLIMPKCQEERFFNFNFIGMYISVKAGVRWLFCNSCFITPLEKFFICPLHSQFLFVNIFINEAKSREYMSYQLFNVEQCNYGTW